MKKIDLTGQRYGNLTVISLGEKLGLHLSWLCLCDCGNIKNIKRSAIRSGTTKSCGCLRKIITGNRARTHGQTNGVEYRIWKGINQRCYNTNTPPYNNYGGRGIEMCDEWKNNFERFLLDVGKRPSTNYSIDRIDNNKGYYPENCHWATRKEQNRNKRNNVMLLNTETGIFYSSLIDAAETIGLNRITLCNRINNNKSPFIKV